MQASQASPKASLICSFVSFGQPALFGACVAPNEFAWPKHPRGAGCWARLASVASLWLGTGQEVLCHFWYLKLWNHPFYVGHFDPVLIIFICSTARMESNSSWCSEDLPFVWGSVWMPKILPMSFVCGWLGQQWDPWFCRLRKDLPFSSWIFAIWVWVYHGLSH